MFERAVNVFWIALGVATAAYSYTIGLIGVSGPESGLFPFIAALIVTGAGIALFGSARSRAAAPVYPHGAALGRVLGVVGGLAFMAVGIPWLGFAVAGGITMMILLRTVEHARWWESVALSVASVAVVSWLFGHVLGMALPRGPWGW
jgi:putative tricarboxylic transport membrane protein